jgi:protein TonB
MGASFPNSPATRDPVSHLKRQARRILPLCLIASALLHSGVLALFTGMAVDRVSPRVLALDVRLLVAAPLAVIPVEPEQSPAGRPRGAQKASAVMPSRERQAQPGEAPVVAPPEAEAVARINAVWTAPAPESPTEADGTRADPASAAATGREPPTARKAAYLHSPPPAYPVRARRNGEEGTVTLRVLVARDGAPASVVVERSSGHARLDRSALEAVRAWRFVPAHEHGEAVETWMLVPVAFRLQDAS